MKRLLVLSSLLFLTAQAVAEPLVIYSGRSDKFVRPVLEAFTAQTGIEVVLHSAKSTALLNKLRLEGERTDADLFISNDAGSLQAGSDMGLFRAIDADLIQPIAPGLRAPDNSWTGLSARARVLVINTQAQGLEGMDSVFDLADPALKGRLAITHSANESYVAGVSVYQAMAGDQAVRSWLQGMKANVDGAVFNKHSKIVAAVAAGRMAVGLVNHYYVYRHLASDPDAPIRIILPDQGEGGMGVAWNVAGVAVSRYSDQHESVNRLIAFLVSEPGQRMFAEVNQEYPARAGVSAAAGVPAAGSYRVAAVPMVELGKRRGATLDLLEAVGMP